MPVLTRQQIGERLLKVLKAPATTDPRRPGLFVLADRVDQACLEQIQEELLALAQDVLEGSREEILRPLLGLPS